MGLNTYTVYTDGAYSLSRDIGGAAFVFTQNDKKIFSYSKRFTKTTNNKMEIIAVLLALKCIKNPIYKLIIVSDSKYVIGQATSNWKRNCNIRLLEQLDYEVSRVCSLSKEGIDWIHVRGHQKDDSIHTRWNNFVDYLALQETL